MNQGGSYIKDPLTGKISLVERTGDSAPAQKTRPSVIETTVARPAAHAEAELPDQSDNSGKTRKPKE